MQEFLLNTLYKLRVRNINDQKYFTIGWTGAIAKLIMIHHTYLSDGFGHGVCVWGKR